MTVETIATISVPLVGIICVCVVWVSVGSGVGRIKAHVVEISSVVGLSSVEVSSDSDIEALANEA
jgi:hypothetical protein